MFSLLFALANRKGPVFAQSIEMARYFCIIYFRPFFSFFPYFIEKKFLKGWGFELERLLENGCERIDLAPFLKQFLNGVFSFFHFFFFLGTGATSLKKFSFFFFSFIFSLFTHFYRSKTKTIFSQFIARTKLYYSGAFSVSVEIIKMPFLLTLFSEIYFQTRKHLSLSLSFGGKNAFLYRHLNVEV